MYHNKQNKNKVLQVIQLVSACMYIIQSVFLYLCFANEDTQHKSDTTISTCIYQIQLAMLHVESIQEQINTSDTTCINGIRYVSDYTR